jgi:hypothetical protein
MKLVVLLVVFNLSTAWAPLPLSGTAANITFPVAGSWTGTYKYDPTVSANQRPQYFSFVIKPGGKMMVKSKESADRYSGFGTWVLKGNKLRCSYTYTTSVLGVPLAQTAIATFSPTGTLRSGVWFNDNNPAMKGTFIMDKVK